MATRAAALALALLATLPTLAAASTSGCTEYTEPTLCDSGNQVVMPEVACSSGRYDFTPLQPCCALQASAPRPCELPPPLDGSRCRSVQIGAPTCPPDSNAFCAVQEMKLKIAIEFQQTNRTCCDSCTCYGDPHCESFDARSDTWVICDARTPAAGKTNCPMSQQTCTQQKDHLGRPCVWQTNPNGKRWIVGVQGSPCIPGPSPEPPMMTMYAADDFSLTLTMGERSIISAAIIKDGPSGDTYVLAASDCYFANNPTPWRPSLGASAAPTDPTWLPYSWTWTPLDGGDLLWTVTGLPSFISLSIRCTRTVERVGGQIQYSQPRLNIESLVEPMNWRPELAGPGVYTRKNVAGFCATGYIEKQGSTGNTDYINKNGLCQSSTNNLDVAKILCSPGTTAPGVTGCMYNWCKSVRTDWEECFQDIQTYQWSTTWCAAHLLRNGTAAGCAADNLCKRCMNSFSDGLSWQQVIEEFGNTQVSNDECVPQSSLASDLVDCQGGVTVQYESSPGVWIPYIGVPNNVKVCGGGLSFDSQKDSPLFIHPVRVTQCSPGTSCLQDVCQSTIGFSASFQYEATPNPEKQIVDLFNEGILVCEPSQYPGNPRGCVNSGGLVPTRQPTVKMCPCPSG